MKASNYDFRRDRETHGRPVKGKPEQRAGGGTFRWVDQFDRRGPDTMALRQATREEARTALIVGRNELRRDSVDESILAGQLAKRDHRRKHRLIPPALGKKEIAKRSDLQSRVKALEEK